MNQNGTAVQREFVSKAEKLKLIMTTKSKKGPPVGYDRRYPNQKPLTARSFASPLLSAEPLATVPLHPFMSVELGGNMLNLNQIVSSAEKNERKVQTSQSEPTPQNILNPNEDIIPAYIPVSCQKEIFCIAPPNSQLIHDTALKPLMTFELELLFSRSM